VVSAQRERSIRTALARRLASAALAALLVSVAVPSGFVAAADEPKSYIVVFRSGIASNAKTDDVERRIGFASDFRYASALQGFAARLNSVQLARLRADPDVAFVSADRVLRAIGNVPIAAGDSAPPGIQRIGAATSTSVREASTANVAVIDSGIDLNHPDLNAVNGKNCIGSGSARDDNGHGTHVAGTIGAKNNGSGVTGVAPGTKIYAVKVINAQGSGTDAQVICGIDWVTANAASLGIKVANMSLGGPGADDGNCGNSIGDALHRAICNSVAAGVTYVVAAGNSGEDFAADVPANYNETLTVTAMADFNGLPGGGGSAGCADGFFEEDDSAAGFSNFTTEGSADAAHTIAAPGVCIRSTWPSNRYQTISGTSMASPHMAGVVALCFGERGAAGPCTGLTPAQVIARMRTNAAQHALADPASGFDGDPANPIGAYYGYLAWAGAIVVDTTPPVISAVNATGMTHEAAKINWTTDENADSQVEYGRTAAYGSTTAVTSAFVKTHAVNLSGLSPTTAYHYRVKSRDGWGNVAVSGDFTFTTTLVLSDLALTGSVAPESAAIGDTLTYQLALTNNGPARASGGTLALTLPAGLSPGSATVSQGSCQTTGQTVSCALGVLEAGITAGLVSDRPTGFWRLGDPGTSSVAADASGNGLSGVYDPGVSRGQPGAVSGDTAAAFSGSVTVTVPAAASLDIRSAVSVEAWVRPSAAQNGGIIEKTVDGWANSQYLLFLEGGVAKFRVRNAAGALQTIDGPALALGTWSHVVGTFDGATMRIYVNGALAASTALAGPLAGGSGPVYIGRLGQSLYPFQGTLDEVAVFPQALSAERVRAHYQGGGVTLRLSATATAAGSQRATAQASAAESDPDPANNTLNLDSTIH
jgi:subtilisin